LSNCTTTGYEAALPLKQAHKLTPAVLYPKNIEKTSVKLSIAVFCESTRDALNYYATHANKPEWSSTADFISLILKLWNVMNVKSSSKGKHKRDCSMDPVRSADDWKLDFLRQFAEFLQRWESMGKESLTKETFLALRQTCVALADCSAYLIGQLNFKYVLLGSLQSDPLESRFGWFRQLSGANYYISMRQVLESDKKIRALSLLKFSKVTLREIDEAIEADCSPSASNSDTDNVADAISSALKFNCQPTSNHRNIIFYVSGAIARSTVNVTKCDHCRESLVSPKDTAAAAAELGCDLDSDDSASEFLDSINRGGLITPTHFLFRLAEHCWCVFQELWINADLKAKFLTAAAHQTLFCKIMDRATYNDQFIHLLFGHSVCSAGHDLQQHIIRRIFNCFAKIFVRKMSDAANRFREPAAKQRKIAKLSSSSGH